MPAPIYDLVAEELNLDPDRSRKLVRAMIREIRKRARKGSGVRVPGLGAFRGDGDTIVFQPEPSLARTVNQRFQGLDDESIASGGDESSEGGPTTITRGFEVGSWDPLDTGTAEAESSSEPAPDTDEFQAPDTDEFDAPPEETSPPEPDAEDAEPVNGDGGDASAAEPSPDPKPEAGTPDEDTSSRFDWQETSTAQGVQDENQRAEGPKQDAAGESSSEPEPSDAFTPPAPEKSSSKKSSSKQQPVDKPTTEEPATEEPATEEPTVEETPDRPGAGAPEPAQDEPAASDLPEGPWQDASEEDASEPPEIHDTREPGDASDSASGDVREDASEPDDDFAMPDVSDSERDDEDESPNIWESDFAWDFSSVSSEDVDETKADDRDAFDDEPSPESETPASPPRGDVPTGTASGEDASAETASDDASSREASRSIFDFDASDFESDVAGKPDAEEAPTTQNASSQATGRPEPAPNRPASDRPASDRPVHDRDEAQTSSSLPTVITVSVIFILVAMGAWILLGQRGVLAPPQETLGLGGGDATPRSQPAASSESGTPDADEASPAPNSSTVDEPTSSSSDDASPDGAATATSDRSDRQAFNRAAGGFTIVVASRTSEQAARDLLPDYRQQFSEQGYAVDLVSGTSNGVTRYRVGVGQFNSRSEARTFLDQNQDRLPQGAWPTQVE